MSAHVPAALRVAKIRVHAVRHLGIIRRTDAVLPARTARTAATVLALVTRR